MGRSETSSPVRALPRQRPASAAPAVSFVGLNDASVTVHPPAVDILALDVALEELGVFHPRQADGLFETVAPLTI